MIEILAYIGLAFVGLVGGAAFTGWATRDEIERDRLKR